MRQYYEIPARPGSPSPGTLRTTRWQVFCNDYGMNPLAISSADTKYGGPVDVSPTTVNGHAKSNRPANIFRWDSKEGVLITKVCQAVNSDWKSPYLESYERACKGSNSGMCSPAERNATMTIMQMTTRGVEAIFACASVDPVTGPAGYKKIVDAMVTRALTQDPDCANAVCGQFHVNELIQSFERNRLLGDKGQACTLIEDNQRLAQEAAVDEAKEQKKKAGTEALVAYLACAADQTPKLDDRVSSAQDIATGLHSACLSYFTMSADLLGISLSGRANYAAQVRPKLVEFVLKYRAMSKSAPAPQPAQPKPIPKAKQIEL